VEQVVINKSITLTGTDHSTYIKPPANLAAPTVNNPDAIVEITGSCTSAQISHFTITADGPTQNLLYGVRVDGNATAYISNNTISNIVDASDPSLGVAIDIGNTSSADGTGDQVGTATVKNNSISGYQRAGVVVNNNGSSAEVENNSITASAVYVSDSQTGVEVSDLAVAHIKNNTITGNTNAFDGSGILIFNPGAIVMSGHHIGDDDNGGCGWTGDDGQGFGCDFNDDDSFGCHGGNDSSHSFFITTIENNHISGNDYGIFGAQIVLTVNGQDASLLVSNNKVFGNTYVGAEFDNSSFITINNNRFTGNGQDNNADGGIYLFQSTYNVVSNNSCTNNNGSGLYLDAGSSCNLLENNVLSGNVYDLSAGNADAVDLSSGNGTAGTANTWINNSGQTFISNGNVLKHRPKAKH
jgi:parallel beta-helix repeat protein